MAAAARASFAPDPRRRTLIAKVKVAQKQLGLVEDDYRAVLFRIAGKTSAAHCTDAELVLVLKEFERKGFRALPAKAGAAGKPKGRPADSPMAGKARAMWISLHQLAAVANPSEQALEAFARRQLGVERMQWADQAKAYKLIEALKAMATRAGWDQDVAGILPAMRVQVLRHRLCDAIVAKLRKVGIVARHWTLDDAAWHLCGIRRREGQHLWETSDFDVIAAGLGAKLRAARYMQDEPA